LSGDPGERMGKQHNLVALYSNYWFSLYSGSLALLPNPAFTVGSLWFASRQALERIGRLEPFTGYVTDDAAIGRVVVAAGLRNHPLRTPASLHLE
jgi:streptogramin lyase